MYIYRRRPAEGLVFATLLNILLIYVMLCVFVFKKTRKLFLSKHF